MKLIESRVLLYKSIDDSEAVKVEPDVTIIVGQNESGKTAFLQALHKAFPVEPNIKYSVTEEYPRKGLNNYQKKHDDNPAVVCELTYKLTSSEITKINDDFGFELLNSLTFTYFRKYAGNGTVSVSIDEKPLIDHLLKSSNLTTEIKSVLQGVDSITQMLNLLQDLDLNSEEKLFFDELTRKYPASSWENRLEHYVWETYLLPHIPKFLYFDDYRVLPGKINLTELKKRVNLSNQNSQPLNDEDMTALSLLQIADVELDEITDSNGYENIKAKLEAISNSITDKIFEYWKQNQELDVEFDIRQDPSDTPPFNNGNNLYIRIRNRKHRVTVPFSQRSKGFIWFFSFIVWFDSIKQQLKTDEDLILLLDEPGLSLHALAQADFLNYIEYLSNDHQIIYTTHSPFMVPRDKISQVRMVEDKSREGTKITSNLSSSDPKTVFPLQAALGYTIAQNLFIAKKNLLVEGPADLVYLKYFSSILEAKKMEFLNPNITIVPVGGLDKLSTFVALLGGNDLEFLVLHDYNNKPDPKLESLKKERLIKENKILNYGMFRNNNSKIIMNSDVEDLMEPKLYLHIFNSAYKDELGGIIVAESDLPNGERIVDRINRFLKEKSITLRPSGGYNHYMIANHLMTKSVPASKLDKKTIERFNILFQTINSQLAT
ncbi:AAA family ATPase [Paenibacillus senegalimassiliensis]|uniref:AAA family ATPase n=1 Tax=Paenibacillus senegalimassiliensis TaxID=1737426 RepID=UPI00073E4A7B|nr:AAA family ATPase [Paenibacillus senegalimassiliensis]